MKAPAFQFYPSDFMSGVILFSNEEIGIYLRLLCYQWDNNRIPLDEKLIAKIAVCKQGKLPAVLAKFKMDDGGYFNGRLENERVKQQQYREKQASNGQKRWLGDAKPLPNPDAKPPALGQPAGLKAEDGEEDFCNREGIARGMRHDGFPEAWRDWRAYRSEINKPLTSYTTREQMIKCERVGSKKSVAMIRMAIEKSWNNLLQENELQHEQRNSNSRGGSREGASKSAEIDAGKITGREL